MPAAKGIKGYSINIPGAITPKWINFNPSIDKSLHPLQSVMITYPFP